MMFCSACVALKSIWLESVLMDRTVSRWQSFGDSAPVTFLCILGEHFIIFGFAGSGFIRALAILGDVGTIGRGVIVSKFVSVRFCWLCDVRPSVTFCVTCDTSCVIFGMRRGDAGGVPRGEGVGEIEFICSGAVCRVTRLVVGQEVVVFVFPGVFFKIVAGWGCSSWT